MIVSLLAETESTLSAYTKFLQDRQQASHVGQTLDSLKVVNVEIELYFGRYRRLAPRLSSSFAPDYTDQIAGVHQRLLESRQSFDAYPWQVKQLQRIMDDIKKLNQELSRCWTIYAQRAILPKLEMYRLLAELPEIQRNSSVILQAKRTLEQLASTPPDNDVQLKSFDEQLEHLTTLITGVVGITPVVREFLIKVHGGAYTLSDLDDEVLAWCRINDRGRSFKITA